MIKVKNLFVSFLLAVLLLSATAAAAKSPKKEDTAAKLVRIEQARDELSRKLNITKWECYLDWSKRTGNMADMSKFKGLRLRSLCDTVPALERLWVVDSMAYTRWQEVLRTDLEYVSIHDEYISLKGINDKDKTNANLQRYNLMYDRLQKNNPDYSPARDAKNESRRVRNEAIARYLLESYRAQAKILPTNDVISFAQMRALRAEYPVIADLEQELATLNKLQEELREEQLREQYNMNQPAKADQKDAG